MNKGKIILLIGPRQVGKTTIFRSIIDEYSAEKDVLFWNCDEPDIRAMLTNPNSKQLQSLVGGSTFVVVDEAQRVENIGLTLKLLHDTLPKLWVAVTGSSSLDLAGSINESLTGRKFEYHLYPFSFSELVKNSSLLEQTRLLEHRLIYGFYPDVVLNAGDESEILSNIVDSYLYKDIFNFKDLRKPGILDRLVQALALQIGSEVSFSELSNLLGIDSLTVQRYINLLEQAYIVFHLNSYSGNLRNELKKSIKIYFYDLGIRNAVISDYRPLSLRADVGALWENFLIAERLKYHAYRAEKAKYYFWRTTQRQEIDFIEQTESGMSAFEFKYNPHKAKVKCPLTFSKAYPNVSFNVVTRDNYTDFIM